MFGATFVKELFELKFLNRDEGWSRHGEWEIWKSLVDGGTGSAIREKGDGKRRSQLLTEINSWGVSASSIPVVRTAKGRRGEIRHWRYRALFPFLCFSQPFFSFGRRASFRSLHSSPLIPPGPECFHSSHCAPNAETLMRKLFSFFAFVNPHSRGAQCARLARSDRSLNPRESSPREREKRESRFPRSLRPFSLN